MPHPDRLIQTVAAVIRDAAGRVLLVRKRGSGILIQPGGKRAAGESSLDTLARELAEELGVRLRADSARRLGEFEDVAVHEPGLRVRAEVFEVAIEGEPAAQAEIAELVWVDPAAPDAHAIAPLSRDWILPRMTPGAPGVSG